MPRGLASRVQQQAAERGLKLCRYCGNSFKTRRGGLLKHEQACKARQDQQMYDEEIRNERHQGKISRMPRGEF